MNNLQFTIYDQQYLPDSMESNFFPFNINKLA